MQTDYEEFLQSKRQIGKNYGFKSIFIPDYLFDFQKYIVEWSLKKGRSAVFADTGLGKTPMQLVWAQNIVEKTNKNVLILTPLAVSIQTVLEGEKFGIEVKRSRDGKPKGKITVTNYQQLNKFDFKDYIGCVCDESGILKNYKAQTKKDIIRFMNKMPYRLLCTATPSPNDYTELGNSSEALGELKYMDMLIQFFRDTSNDKNPQWSTPTYVLKGHAIHDFWRWVISWAIAMRKPSDLGFDDSTHILPELVENEHILKCTKPLKGFLIPFKAKTLREQRQERRKTIEYRTEKTLELCKKHDISVIWGHYNYETDFLEKNIPDSLQISGKDKDEEKEEKFNLFLNKKIKRLIIKPKIGAFGLNWQHCNHIVTFISHSFEQHYQLVRRCWRYGQKNKVIVDIISTEGEGRVLHNIKRKAKEADNMFTMLVKFMNNELNINRKEIFNEEMRLPKWL